MRRARSRTVAAAAPLRRAHEPHGLGRSSGMAGRGSARRARRRWRRCRPQQCRAGRRDRRRLAGLGRRRDRARRPVGRHADHRARRRSGRARRDDRDGHCRCRRRRRVGARSPGSSGERPRGGGRDRTDVPAGVGLRRRTALRPAAADRLSHGDRADVARLGHRRHHRSFGVGGPGVVAGGRHDAARRRGDAHAPAPVAPTQPAVVGVRPRRLGRPRSGGPLGLAAAAPPSGPPDRRQRARARRRLRTRPDRPDTWSGRRDHARRAGDRRARPAPVGAARPHRARPAVLVSPTRPGSVLAEAARRGIGH